MPTLLSNVRKIYLFRLAKFSYFHVPIIIIFYGSRGVGFAEAMLLRAVYYAAKVASEAPTGAVVDRISRRFSLFLAALASGAGYLVIFLSHDFWAFAAGEVLAGIGISLAFAAAGPLMGLAVDYLPLNYTLAIIGAAIIVFFAPVIIKRRKIIG